MKSPKRAPGQVWKLQADNPIQYTIISIERHRSSPDIYTVKTDLYGSLKFAANLCVNDIYVGESES